MSLAVAGKEETGVADCTCTVFQKVDCAKIPMDSNPCS